LLQRPWQMKRNLFFQRNREKVIERLVNNLMLNIMIFLSWKFKIKILDIELLAFWSLIPVNKASTKMISYFIRITSTAIEELNPSIIRWVKMLLSLNYLCSEEVIWVSLDSYN
jgi:hypothetical protein